MISFPYLTQVWYWKEFFQFREKLPHEELHVCVVAEAVFCWKNLLWRTKVADCYSILQQWQDAAHDKTRFRMKLPCLVEMLPLCWLLQQSLNERHKNGLLCIHLCISTLKDTITVTWDHFQPIQAYHLTSKYNRQATWRAVTSLWKHSLLCILVGGSVPGEAVYTECWLFPHFCTTQE